MKPTREEPVYLAVSLSPQGNVNRKTQTGREEEGKEKIKDMAPLLIPQTCDNKSLHRHCH